MNYTRLHDFAKVHRIDYEALIVLFSVELKSCSDSMRAATVELDRASQTIQRQSESLKALDERVIAFNTSPWYKRLWRSLWPI